MALIELNFRPSRRELRVFSALFIAFFAIIGAMMVYRTGHRQPGLGLAIGTAVLGLAGVLRPAIIRPVYVVWMAAVYPIGWVVSGLIVTIVYYAILTPIGLLMRLFRLDPMERTFDRGASSYWVSYQPDRSTDRYFRQY